MDEGSPVDGSPVDPASPEGDTTDSAAVLPEAAKITEAAGGSEDPVTKKSKKRKRNLTYFTLVHKADQDNVKRLLAMK